MKNNKSKNLKFMFIRHGETPWNRENRAQGSSNDPVNNGLTKEGRENVELSAVMLNSYFRASDISPKDIYIYTTPMHRTYDTGKIVQQTIGIPKSNFIIHPELNGRYYGEIEGTKDVKKPKTIIKNPRLALSYVLSQLGVENNGKGIETKPGFKARVFNALNDIINDSIDNDAKVVILACNSDVWDVIRKEPVFEEIFNFEFKQSVDPGEFVSFDVEPTVLEIIKDMKYNNDDDEESSK